MAVKRPPYDVELEPILKAFPELPPLTPEAIEQTQAGMLSMSTPELILTDPAISHEEKTIPGPGGKIELTILRSKTSTGGLRPVIYYMHGGGMLLGSRLFGLNQTFEWIKELDAVLISVEYRLSPKHSNPAQVEDCYAGLQWVSKNAKALGIDGSKIIIAGFSAGGGLAAGVALLARDQGGPKIFAQCLMAPMLDNTTSTASAKQYMNEGSWTGENNIKAWEYYVPGHKTAKDVSIYAAPARAKDLSGLPQAWVDVGGAELFRDEDTAYASKLAEDGVLVELHVWPGGFHAFDAFAPNASLSKSCHATRLAWFKRVLGAQQPAPNVATML